MEKLTRDDLSTLEAYAEARAAFRRRVLDHKKRRQVAIGPHATLYFEDRLTVLYQVQEMLRVERIFEPAEIEAELAAYNPLIPNGENLKATFMLEYTDVAERQRALAELVGIEDRVWLRVGGGEPVWAVADEDMERADGEKTAAVHFLRFEPGAAAAAAARAGADLGFGIDHERYRHEVDPVARPVRDALVADLSDGDGGKG